MWKLFLGHTIQKQVGWIWSRGPSLLTLVYFVHGTLKAFTSLASPAILLSLLYSAPAHLPSFLLCKPTMLLLLPGLCLCCPPARNPDPQMFRGWLPSYNLYLGLSCNDSPSRRPSLPLHFQVGILTPAIVFISLFYVLVAIYNDFICLQINTSVF